MSAERARRELDDHQDDDRDDDPPDVAGPRAALLNQLDTMLAEVPDGTPDDAPDRTAPRLRLGDVFVPGRWRHTLARSRRRTMIIMGATVLAVIALLATATLMMLQVRPPDAPVQQGLAHQAPLRPVAQPVVPDLAAEFARRTPWLVVPHEDDPMHDDPMHDAASATRPAATDRAATEQPAPPAAPPADPATEAAAAQLDALLQDGMRERGLQGFDVRVDAYSAAPSGR